MPSDHERIRSLQTRLNELGYGPLDVDGRYGKATQAAYHRYLDDIDPGTPTVTPEAAKPWWLSRTILGLLATALAMAAGRFGWEVNDDELLGVLTKLVEVGGLLLAFWGTVRRAGPIDQTLVARLGDRDLRLPVPAHRTADSPADPHGVFGDS